MNNFNVSPVDIILFFIPITTGFSFSFIFKVDKRSSERVKFRPPTYVFTAMWIILYLLMGFSWVLANREHRLNNIIYSILNMCLLSWIVIYKYNQSKSVVPLMLALTTAIMSMTIGTKVSRLLIAPLLSWLLYATLMLTTELQTR